MVNLWLLSMLCISLNHAAKLWFKPSPSSASDEYCIHKLNDEPTTTTYCNDIDNILAHACGNTTFLSTIAPNYDAEDDNGDSECLFRVQSIGKTYSISDEVQIDKITFFDDTQSTIYLSQSFLSITSFNGEININNMDFVSNGDLFPFIDVASAQNEVEINVNACLFTNITAINGTIINIPYNGPGDTAALSIIFEDCVMENNMADYGGILYIERNNVYVTFSNVIAHDIVTFDGSVVDWMCQQHYDNSDLCGDLYITDTTFTDIDANIFTIDVSLDPDHIQFMLNVDASTFTNINGIIFNFNHGNDELSPTTVRVQQQNAFINITNSLFQHNGHKHDVIQQYNHYLNTYIDWYTYPHNGTIFKINSVTVPNITVQQSTFTDNAGLHGTIFHWYCSRSIVWLKDSYCGSIVIQNSIFNRNFIPDDYFVRYGSVMYAQILPNMEFNLLIQDCKFNEQIGNAFYIDTASVPDMTDLYSNYSMSNYSMSNYSISNYAMPDWVIPASVIYVENSQFINCEDSFIDSVGAILTIKELDTIYTFITDSTFEGNQCRYGAAVFSADYAPIINITNGIFTGNGAVQDGIFHIEQETDGLFEIHNSIFANNGYYTVGDYYGSVSIISTAHDVNISLNIVESSFIRNTNAQYGCFNLYRANISITDSTFDSNRGYSHSVIVLYLREQGSLNIMDSMFKNNYEVSAAFDSGLQAMFHVEQAVVVVDNVEFKGNTVLKNGMYVTKKSILLSDNKYIDNTIPCIVDGGDIDGLVSIQGCTFLNNDVTFWLMFDARNVLVDHSNFMRNSKTPLFGSIDDDFALTLIDSNFRMNHDADNGSIIFVQNSEVSIEIDDCRFLKNAVSGYGGVIYIEGSGRIEIKDSEFTKNTAEIGEVLYAQGIDTLSVNIMNTKFGRHIANGNTDFGNLLYVENVTVNIGGEQPNAAMFIEDVDHESIESLSHVSYFWVSMLVCGINVFMCLSFRCICSKEGYDNIDVDEDEDEGSSECGVVYDDK